MNTGLPTKTNVMSIAFDNTYAYIGTSADSVYRQLLTEFTGIESEQNSFYFDIYPNPTTDVFYIDCGNNFNGYKVRITNILYQTIFNFPISSQITSINLKTLTGYGIYFVTLFDANNNNIATKKIILK